METQYLRAKNRPLLHQTEKKCLLSLLRVKIWFQQSGLDHPMVSGTAKEDQLLICRPASQDAMLGAEYQPRLVLIPTF